MQEAKRLLWDACYRYAWDAMRENCYDLLRFSAGRPSFLSPLAESYPALLSFLSCLLVRVAGPTQEMREPRTCVFALLPLVYSLGPREV